MNESQEHKTWIMLRKAWHEEAFNSSIIPIMTSANKAKNKYGEWQISSANANAWKLFDNTHDTAIGLAEKGTVWVTINLPKGVSMKVTKIAQQKKANAWTYFTFYGVTDDGVQEQLSNKTLSDSYSQYEAATINTNKFYNKFMLKVRNGASTTTSAASGFWILGGIIKY